MNIAADFYIIIIWLVVI